MILFRYLPILILISLSTLKAQVVYEPIHKDIYIYLSTLSQKGIIDFNDRVKPLSRGYIASKIQEISENKKGLTSVERDELEFYRKEYVKELKMLNGNTVEKPVSNFGYDAGGRVRLFSYDSDIMSFNIDPIIGYQFGGRNNIKSSKRWNGFGVYGYLDDLLGLSIDFRYTTETPGQSGGNYYSNVYNRFTPETGIKLTQEDQGSIGYHEARSVLATDWKWGSFAVGKDFLEWGYAESGKLVLSNKAPSFPFIRLDIYPTDWFRFNYIHAWLSSFVEDSSAAYLLRDNRERLIFKEKYYALHSFTIMPLKGLDISFGESVVYGDKLQISYLMPFMIFSFADLYLSEDNNRAGANSQFFFSLSSRNHLPNTHFYGTMFVDDIQWSNLFDAEKQVYKFGFTLGSSVADLLVDNLKLTAEYTKIYPSVYTHFIQNQTYESSSYSMGHWIGHNADILYLAARYRIIRGLESKLWTQLIRKGGEGEIKQFYVTPQPEFLFGLNNYFNFFGLDLKYEIIHDLNISINYQYSKISKEEEDGLEISDSYSDLRFALYFGL